ncbi:hypothetical protein D3C83_87830 [compost metagenome]
MATQLSGFVEMRKPGPDHKDYNGAMFVGDDCGYITRRSSDRYIGSMNFNDRREARTLLEEFEEIWNKANPDANLRNVVI